MADIKCQCFVTYDDKEIFDNEIKQTGEKAYITATPLDESDHVTSQVFDKEVYIGEHVGYLHAKKFIGDLEGNATSAVKLDTSSTGSADKPVYFTDGKPAACTLSFKKMTLTEYEATTKDPNTVYFVI